VIADTFAYWGYTVGWTTVRRMPERRAYSMFARMADSTWQRHGSSVKQYEKNLRRVVPGASAQQIRQMSRAGLRSYARYWCDAFRMPDWPHDKIVNLPVVGLEHLDDSLAAGRRVFFVSPHAGNYDWGAAFLAQRYGSCTTVAENLKPDRLFRKFVAFRSSLGMEIIGTKTPHIIDLLTKRVEAGRLAGLVGDRDLSRHGVPVEFFGEPTSFPRGPAVVARRTGALVLPVSFYYTQDSAAARIFPPIEPVDTGDDAADIRSTTQLIADQLAVGIADHPTDWHMLQPLWLADLDPDRGPRRGERR
jgi:KDO2-lipid IV(A) lauroyltransferase